MPDGEARSRALLALTGLAAVGGLVALPGSASASTCTSEFAVGNTAYAAADDGLVRVIQPKGVKTYEYGNSPYIGARYDRCLRKLEVYYGGYEKNSATSHYNVRLFNGQTKTLTAYASGNGVWTPTLVSAKDPGYHFAIQACNGDGVKTKLSCSAWSPDIAFSSAY